MRPTSSSPRTGVTDQGGYFPDLRDRIIDAVRRVDLDHPVAERLQHVAGGALGEAPRQHEVGRAADHGLGLGGIMTEPLCLLREEGQGRIGRIDREGRNLMGIGERDQQFVRAEIDRNDPLRLIGRMRGQRGKPECSERQNGSAEKHGHRPPGLRHGGIAFCIPLSSPCSAARVSFGIARGVPREA